MSTVTESIQAIIDVSAIADKWANGSASETVQTKAGSIKTLAGITNSVVDDLLSVLSGTSNSQVVLSTGVKTFLTQPNKGFKAGMLISATAPDGSYMSGTVISYGVNTLVMNVTANKGSGTYSSWQLTFSGPAGNSPEPIPDNLGVAPTFVTKLPWE